LAAGGVPCIGIYWNIPNSATTNSATEDLTPTHKNNSIMNDTIRSLKEHYGANSPAVAEQLNSIGVELQCGGDTCAALKFHQEALGILEWNKCNALLFDFVEKSKEYTIEMALTLRMIGNILREMNNFVGAAEVYKECLDTFLEGLVEGGGALKRKLLECEYKKDNQGILNETDRKTIGRVLCLHPVFQEAVRDISQLFSEMQCVKFVGQNAASSRRRRRMVQHSAMEENLKNAVESLSLSTCNDEMDQQRLHPSMNGASDNEAWMSCFWEKEMGRFSRPRPLSRRSITSDEVCDHYKALSTMIIPAEESLAIALNRFPLPASVAGDDCNLRQRPRLNQRAFSEPLLQVSTGYTERDSEELIGAPHHLIAGKVSPRCVAQPVFLDDSMFKPKSKFEMPL